MEKLKMTKERKQARRETGIAAFERECECELVTGHDGRRRWTKRYRIPGTPEHGRYAMLQRYTESAHSRLVAVSK